MSGGHGDRPSLLELGRGLLAVAAVLALVRALHVAGIEGHGGPLFAMGFLILGGTVAGSVAAFVGLPRLTGYLLAGLLSGPQGFALFSAHEVKALGLANALALALIALQGGAEMTLSMLKRTARSVLISSAVQIAICVPAVALCFFLVADYIPFAQGRPVNVVIAIALVWGVIALTRSPSVTLAVLGETKAKGPVADWALGIVVLLDVVNLAVFAVALSIAKGQLLGDPFEASALLTLGHELFASMAAGVTFGLVVAGLLRVITSERVLMVCAIAYGVTALCQYLHYDTLLVFVVAGFLVTNLTKQGPPLIETSDKTSAAVMVVFFATAGAKLDLQALLKLWPVAIGLFAARVIFSFVSAKIGHAIAKDPPVVRKNAWLGLVSQAGVTIGFATIAGDALPVVGPPLASLAIAVVGLNELVGAALFKFSLMRAGEISKDAPGPTGGAAPSDTHGPSPPT